MFLKTSSKSKVRMTLSEVELFAKGVTGFSVGGEKKSPRKDPFRENQSTQLLTDQDLLLFAHRLT